MKKWREEEEEQVPTSLSSSQDPPWRSKKHSRSSSGNWSKSLRLIQEETPAHLEKRYRKINCCQRKIKSKSPAKARSTFLKFFVRKHCSIQEEAFAHLEKHYWKINRCKGRSKSKSLEDVQAKLLKFFIKFKPKATFDLRSSWEALEETFPEGQLPLKKIKGQILRRFRSVLRGIHQIPKKFVIARIKTQTSS